jgi:hypothetical protein
MTQIRVDYRFEQLQNLRFSVYDVDDNYGVRLEKQDFLGSADTPMAKIFTSPGKTLTLHLKSTNGKEYGTVTVRGDEENSSGVRGTLYLDMYARNLDNKDGLFGKSDPFLVFCRIREDGSAVPVTKTEVIQNNLNPKWRTLTVPIRDLCNGDLQRPVIIECYDWDKSDKFELIGAVQVPASQLVSGAQFVLWNNVKDESRRKKNKKYDGSGTLAIQNALFVQEYSFIDFLQAGFEISLMVGIDYTASNQDPRTPGSLHYISPDGALNQYERAIIGVGEVLAPYDADQIFPVYGFGAKLPGSSVVSHCFPLDLNARGVAGLLSAYRNSLRTVALYGPTYFAPLIRTCAELISKTVNKYAILLIITDGAIMDMDETKRAIVETAHLPYSIVIVGVGAADFSSMRELDGDEQRVSFMGKAAARDIVQFVAYRELAQEPPAILAEYVCAEIPTQFKLFAQMYNITPEAVRRVAMANAPPSQPVSSAPPAYPSGNPPPPAYPSGNPPPPAYP